MSGNCQGEEIMAVFTALAQLVLARLESWVLAHGVPATIRSHVEFDSGGFTVSTSPAPDFTRPLLQNPDGAFWAVEEVEPCVSAFDRQGLLFPPIGQPGNERPDIGYAHPKMHAAQILRVIGEAADAYGRPALSLDELQAAFESFASALKDPEVRVIVPLLNTESDMAPVELQHGLELSRFEIKEKAELYDMGAAGGPAGVSPAVLAAARCKLTGRYEFEREGRNGMLRVAGDTGRLLLALRLSAPGDIGTTGLVQMSGRLKYWGGVPGMALNELRPRLGRRARVYHLSANAISGVVGLVEHLCATERNGSAADLSNAFCAFNRSYTRHRPEDRIMDLGSTLDSALLYKGEQGQGLLSARGATLVADIRTACETQGLLRAIYRIQSKIRHEGLTFWDSDSVTQILATCGISLELPAFCQVAEDATRDILRAYATRKVSGESLSSINKSLDANPAPGVELPGGRVT